MLLLISSGGCARSLARIDMARDAFVAGDLTAAEETLVELSQSKDRYSSAASLDLAMVELAAGDAKSAERRFRKLRDDFDALASFAPMHEAAAMVGDDTARVYRPAAYEQIMIRAMLAVCSLATDGADAESYALQAAMRQSELAEDAKSRGIENVSEIYQSIAFAPYLRGVLREATHHDYDDAARAYQLVSAVEPRFSAVSNDIARANLGSHSNPGHGVLYVIGCVGRGPILKEVEAPTTTAAMQIASSVLNVTANQKDDKKDRAVALPNIASVKIPQVITPPSEVVGLGVRADGVAIGVTEVLTSVSELATKQTEAEMPWTIARAVMRRAAKETTVATVGNQLGLSGAAGSLFHFAVASAWSGSEHVDTRCWGLLPREIQVLRAELPAGDYTISLSSIGRSGHPIGSGVERPVTIVDGRNEYIIAIAPETTIYLAK
ncbi:hypothetical protein Q31b_46570 [Novipirellula aureliae]|uniref:Uncharacterized protein n=2 Tax=Novipirellula aureliae TaxID=2527966 RepID=A0A5C6DM44_9BACT|nr:hypothetical protein Q31b_46570 [Novipirellula aureliae]